jgi:Na+-transporting NADH:ubiquinone oxidoreductase subunit NqrC
MSPQETQARSREKVKQVLDLARVLHLSPEAKQQINTENGFIEMKVFWIDSEKYPEAEPEATGETQAPAEEAAEEVVTDAVEPDAVEAVLPVEEGHAEEPSA